MNWAMAVQVTYIPQIKVFDPSASADEVNKWIKENTSASREIKINHFVVAAANGNPASIISVIYDTPKSIFN